MEKRKYEVPVTKYTQVELESGFMVPSEVFEKTDDADVTIKDQTPGVQIGGGTAEEGWDTNDKWNSSKWD